MLKTCRTTTFILLLMLLPQAGIAQQTQRQITVVGTGTVTAEPDILRVTLGVAAEADDASTAIRQMSMQMADVMDVIDALGLPDADIQTSSLRLSERYGQQQTYERPAELIGFQASTAVTIILRDMDEAGSALDAVVASGVNRINGLQFDVDVSEPLRNAARAAAVADAIAKTALYAKAASLTTGDILTMSEQISIGGRPQPMQSFEAAAQRGVPIAAGEIEINASITLVTAIE